MRVTFGAVRSFRKIVREQVERTNAEPFPIPEIVTSGKLAGLRMALFKKYSTAQIAANFIGDAALLYISADEKSEHAPAFSIYRALDLVAVTMLGCMASGILLRGAIGYGVGGFIEGNSFYGQAYYRAVEEERRARWPRIVIGDEFLDYTNYLKEKAERDPNIIREGREFISGWRKEIEHYLSRDDRDGKLIVDYLRDRYKKMSEQDLVQSAARCLKAGLDMPGTDFDQKQRLEYLKAYFDKHRCWMV